MLSCRSGGVGNNFKKKSCHLSFSHLGLINDHRQQNSPPMLRCNLVLSIGPQTNNFIKLYCGDQVVLD